MRRHLKEKLFSFGEDTTVLIKLRIIENKLIFKNIVTNSKYSPC
jgi:hypothetical protein